MYIFTYFEVCKTVNRTKKRRFSPRLAFPGGLFFLPLQPRLPKRRGRSLQLLGTTAILTPTLTPRPRPRPHRTSTDTSISSAAKHDTPGSGHRGSRGRRSRGRRSRHRSNNRRPLLRLLLLGRVLIHGGNRRSNRCGNSRGRGSGGGGTTWSACAAGLRRSPTLASGSHPTYHDTMHGLFGTQRTLRRQFFQEKQKTRRSLYSRTANTAMNERLRIRLSRPLSLSDGGRKTKTKNKTDKDSVPLSRHSRPHAAGTAGRKGGQHFLLCHHHFLCLTEQVGAVYVPRMLNIFPAGTLRGSSKS